jgi:IS605 OrfB family transposase
MPMKIKKAYKFRLKTTVEMENQFLQFAGCCRKVWNLALEISLRRLANKQPILWYHEADFWVKLWKQSEEYGFLKECPAQLLQQKLKDLDKAFRDAFDKTQPKRVPKWRKRGQHDSFRYPQHFKLENRRIFLPKIGWVSFFKSQPIKGNPKNVTVSRKGKHWYVSIQIEEDQEVLIHPNKSAVGIDLGIATFAAISDGATIEAIDVFRTHEMRLAVLQRQLSKKRKFSENWKKQVVKVRRCHQKIANIRGDFLQKESTKLCYNHAMIVVEDLKITNMSQSAKGSSENPGRRVRAKAVLNKAILDQGWGEFKRQLNYKLDWSGGIFLKVNPKYTSQRCNKCGFTDKGNRQSQSYFCCLSCCHTDNADTNAAKNILAAGHAVLACGEMALAASMKQEPLGIGDLVPA